MVFHVRCFKCGAQDARLILGGREILHARCQSCSTNLLAEVMEIEEEIAQRKASRDQRSTSMLEAISRSVGDEITETSIS